MYPVMLNLTDKKIVIIGGGKIALRKTLGILKANGSVTVISPDFLPEFTKLERVTLIENTYAPKYLSDAQLIFACTNSKEINQKVVADASANQWVNNCGQKELSDFFNMNTIKQSDYLIALSSYGENQKLIKKLQFFLKGKLTDFQK
ncbi:precorrin-2 dehydrogenase/sirohydrochlorin ferrochelatase family protein [Enterococcus sp. LJL99]